MSDSKQRPDFQAPDLARWVESIPESELDALPFGAVRLDPQGIVQRYNAAERNLSGSGKRERVGLHFFTTIAPCMNTDAFRGRIDRARQSGALDIEFSHFGDFDDPDRELRIRVQSAPNGGTWIFVERAS